MEVHRILTGVLLTLMFASSAAQTACSQANRSSNLTNCLLQIKTVFIDPSAFWFGQSYQTKCPEGIATPGVECNNPRPNNVDSVATRMFQSGRTSFLSTYIDVTFTSMPGFYSGCGNNFSTTETRILNLDPLSSEVTTPWVLRHLPALSWNYTAGHLYTLIVYDVGNLITHGIYINIEGNDIATSEALDTYSGPLTTRDFMNLYPFMLFKQNGTITVSQEWRDKISKPMGGYLLEDLLTAFNLEGPIALNWMKAKGDEYAAGVMKSLGILNNCPIYVGKALDNQPRPFISRPVKLSASVDVTFQTESINYAVCCKSNTFSARSFMLNPIGNPLYNTAEVRSEANLTISLQKAGIMGAFNNFAGEMHSLIALDPDVPSPSVGTEERPLLHMMVLNIMNGDVTSGSVLLPYSGPTPPDTMHTYYFLLYKHTSSISNETAGTYTGNCTLGIRCLYDISGLVRDNNMTLVGATWLRSTRDSYVNFRNINRGQEPDTVCEGQTGYSNPCPVGAAHHVTMATLATIISIAFSTFGKHI